MSPVPVILLAALAAGLLSKGSLANFERMRLHWWGLALVGLALQAAPVPDIPGLSSRGSGATILIASYISLLTFLVLNRRIPAMNAMTLGLILNLAVVGSNAGMPVSPSAIQAAGASVSEQTGELANGAKHHLMTDLDVLTPLGDVIPIPRPFGVVISIGDVFLYGGMAWFAFQVTRGRSRANPRPLALWFPSYRGKHAPDYWRLSARSRDDVRSATGRSGSMQ
jgi:hypothetical protein